MSRARRYAISNFSATAPPFLWRSSVAPDHLLQILIERGRLRGDTRFGVVAFEQLFFEREEGLLIRIVNDGIVGQRIHQRVGERDPQESWGSKAGADRYSIGEHGLDIQLIEHLRGVIALSVFFHRGSLVAMKHFAMRGEQIGRAGTKADLVGLRFEIFDGQRVILVVGVFARIGGPNGMRVVVDRLDGGDFAGELRVDSGGLRGRGSAGGSEKKRRQ